MSSTITDHIYGTYPGHQAAFLSEFLAFFAKIPTDEARILALQQYLRDVQATPMKVKGLRRFLECMFLPSCKMQLGEGLPSTIPPLHKLPDKVSNSLYKSMGTIAYFLKGTPLFIANQLRRERVFMSLFETMSEGDAYLFTAMKDQKAAFVPGLSYDVVQKAFPGWFNMVQPINVQTTPEQQIKETLIAAKQNTAPAAKEEIKKKKRKPGAGRPKKATSPLV